MGAAIPVSISELQQRLAGEHYIADRGLAIAIFLALRLKRPLFLEGESGVGKTALAGAVAAALGRDLIRLQCYEGLDVGHALYEWDYARQLLELRILEATRTLDRESARRDLYSEAFLIKRPLLQAIDPRRARPAVLLIDEIDRADEEFEGFLLELLSEFQITIPELGTVRASEPPLVILTSNRTREVHDALKRRCLYQWIEYPSFEKEVAIVRERAPEASARLAQQVTAMVQELRAEDLYKVPGVSETIDWVTALVALDTDTLDAAAIDETLGVVLKAKEDLETVRGPRAAELLDRAISRRALGREARLGMSQLLDNLLAFGRVLRRAGIDVHPGRVLDVVEALGHVNLAARDEVYHACRALLVHRHEQIAIFDRVFAAFWRRHRHPEVRIDAPFDEPRTSPGAIEVVLALEEASDSCRRCRRQCAERRKRGVKIWSDRGGAGRQGFRRIHA